MNYIKTLAQDQIEAAEAPTIFRNLTPYSYSLEHGNGDMLGFPKYPRANWFDPNRDEYGRGFDVLVIVLSGMTLDSSALPVSEETDATPFHAFDAPHLHGYPMDPWMLTETRLIVEAWKKRREIAKTNLELLVEKIGSDQIYDLRESVALGEGPALRIEKYQPTKPQWVVEIESYGMTRPSVKQLAYLIKTLTFLSSEGKFEQIDMAFKEINAPSLSLEVLIGLLRSTYHCRDRLPTWGAFLNTAQMVIAERGLDYEEAFSGLFN